MHDARRPCEVVLQAMGLPLEMALREKTALFAPAMGSLLLQHTGRTGLCGQSAALLLVTHGEQLVKGFNPGAPVASRRLDQADFFGL